ncbi:MAG: cobalamin biosynthesis protein, partial [Pseudomonadota bacterium]
MRTAIVTLANVAEPVVRRLQAALPDARVYGRVNRVQHCDEHFELASLLLPQLYRAGVRIVAVCSSGIVMRCLGPILADKHLEPPVLAVASNGSSVVPLIGGHRGANALARDLAVALDAHAAVTTAADVTLGVALDEPLPGYCLVTPEHYPNAVSRLLAGATLRHDSDLPPVVGDAGATLPRDGGEIGITVSADDLPSQRGELHYTPLKHVLGVGCERGCSASELQALVTRSLAEQGISSASIAAVVSLDLKSDEPAVQALAEALKVPARFFDREALAAQADRLANPSEIVRAEVGVPGVAEAAALAAVGDDGVLVMEKRKSARATCALAARREGVFESVSFGRARGAVHLIGTGPGQIDWRLPAVEQVLADCTDLVAYSYYIDLLGPAASGKTVHSFALGEEEKRARVALELAAEGKHVGLICSGDPGIYAMGALVFELVERGGVDAWSRVEIVTTPGITALQAASAKSGAAIGHDFCAISLSDLLTPWDVIEKRLHAAAQGDFVVAFYNPVSKRRDWQLPKAREILLQARPESTPVVIARQLGRDEESIVVSMFEIEDYDRGQPYGSDTDSDYDQDEDRFHIHQ